MKIPNELLEKYNVGLDFGDEGAYRTFLIQTDYELIKSFEKLMGEPLKLVTNFVTIAKENAELVKYRAIARAELKEIENGNTD